MGPDDQIEQFMLKRFEELGEKQVRQTLNTESMSPLKRQIAMEFLAEKDKIARRLAELEHTEQKSAYARAEAAAERAASAAERAASATEVQARAAKHTLIIAIASAILAAIALVVSVFGPFHNVH